MKSGSQYALVLVTTPDVKIARLLSRAALEKRLVACANIIPKIESHYWWQDKIDSSSEVLVILKTTRARLAALEKLVLDKHPYETPEVVALQLTKGNRRYLDWLRDSIQA